jgi:glycine/D-amino acid oxidase-like deaminating enzyme
MTPEWAQGLGARPILLYSGTLALKHNPELLLTLAREVEGADTVVVAAGVGADDLAKAKAEQNLPRLRLLPLQPIEVFA